LVSADTGTNFYLPYGERDYVLRGDDVTSPPLKSPTTVYVGDGSETGFNFVSVSGVKTIEKVKEKKSYKTIEY
jgi:hypothetical protein